MPYATSGNPAAQSVFRSTRVVTPTGMRPCAIHTANGCITSISDWDDLPGRATLHDYADLVLLPGLVDSHVHINDAIAPPNLASRSHWEGFPTATQAAASGGVTTLVDMPLNCVPETLDLTALNAKRAAAHGNVWVDWMTWGGIVGNHDTGGNQHNIPALAAAGVPGFKAVLVHSGIDTFRWADEPQLRRALAQLTGRNLPLLAHAELAEPIQQATAQLAQADWHIYSTYLASRPDQAELDAITLLIRLARDYDVPLHIVHIASAQALPLIRAARAQGLRVTAETCPHYLWFAAEDITDAQTQFKCAPPVRSAANRELLWLGLLEGTLDFVATDHSPCPPALKSPETGRFDLAWGGIASLGLALPVLWTAIQSRGGTLPQLANWLSTAPASLARVGTQKGSLAPGYDADIAVFDPDATWTVTEADLHFRHKLSPYLGAQLTGRVRATWLRGHHIYADGQPFSPPSGRELSPTP